MYGSLPVAQPVPAGREATETSALLVNGTSGQDAVDDDQPPIPGEGCSLICSKCLVYTAMLGSCCTFATTNYVKASLWRTRLVLMLLYVPLLMASATFMYLFYDGYEKVTVLDNRGQATRYLFGEGNLVEQFKWDPEQSCGANATEGFVHFQNHTQAGLFYGSVPEGCARIDVVHKGPSGSPFVIFEATDRGQLLSAQQGANATDFLCSDGLYGVRVMDLSPAGTSSGSSWEVQVTILNSVGGESQVSTYTAALGSPAYVPLVVAGGEAAVISSPGCASLTIPEAPADAIWEVVLEAGPGVDGGQYGGWTVASGMGPQTDEIKVCPPSIPSTDSLWRVRIYSATTGASLLSESSVSCRITVTQPGAGSPTSLYCGGSSLQDVGVLSVGTVGALFLDPAIDPTHCSLLDVSPIVVSAGDALSWWVTSSTGKILPGSSTSGPQQVYLCDTGVYQFDAVAEAGTPGLSLSLGASPAYSTPSVSGLSATRLLRAGDSEAILSPQDQDCMAISLWFDLGGASSNSSVSTSYAFVSSTWTLWSPPASPQLLDAPAWPSVSLTSGVSASEEKRYLCQSGGYYKLSVSAGGGGEVPPFNLAFYGGASPEAMDESCATHVCHYGGCGSDWNSQGEQKGRDACGGAEEYNSVGAIEDGFADLFANGVSLAEVNDELPYLRLGYTNPLGAMQLDEVYFTKDPTGSNGTMIEPGLHDPSADFEAPVLEVVETVVLYCKPDPCPSAPAPSPPALPSPEDDSVDVGQELDNLLSALSTDDDHQCYPYMCDAAEDGKEMEYQCWETEIVYSPGGAVITLISLLICPLMWFTIKMMGLNIEGWIKIQKEKKKRGDKSEGCCSLTTAKIANKLFTFGSNAVLALNMAFAYDPDSNQYFGNVFQVTVWLGYASIILLCFNVLWGCCSYGNPWLSPNNDPEKKEQVSQARRGCMVLQGIFTLCAMGVGTTVWVYGAYDSLEQLCFCADDVLPVLRKIITSIMLLHPNLVRLPDLTPVVLQLTWSTIVITGPFLFFVELISQLPLAVLAGLCGLGSKLAQVQPLGALSAAEAGVSRGEGAEALENAKGIVGGKLAEKENQAREKDKSKMQKDIEGRMGQVAAVQDVVEAFEEEGIPGLVMQDGRVQEAAAIAEDPLSVAQAKAQARLEAEIEAQTIGRVEKMDERDETATGSRS